VTAKDRGDGQGAPPRGAGASGSGRRLRILHAVDYVLPGMGYQMSLLPKWNARHGHDVHVVTSDRYWPFQDYERTLRPLLGPRRCGAGVSRRDGVTIHRLPCWAEYKHCPVLKGLERTIAEIRPDVILRHGTSTVDAFRTALIARRKRIPLLMDNHMVFSVRVTTLDARLMYLFLPAMTRHVLVPPTYRFLGVAQECSRFLEEVQTVPHEKIDLLPLGLDTDLFRPDEQHGREVRRQLDIPQDALIVMQTGNLIPQKGPHWLAEAMAPTMARDERVYLVFVGHGPEEHAAKIRAPLVEAGVMDRVRRIPAVPVREFGRLLNAADVCAWPSEASLSCIEAAGCGKAVVMSGIPASRWRAECGIGVCYETGDVEDLAAVIGRFLADDAYRQATGARAVEAAVSHFSYDAVARRAEDFMIEAIEDHQRRRGT